ncbi:MAG: hypothetical protein QM498_05405 [Desulfobacterium sp.]
MKRFFNGIAMSVFDDLGTPMQIFLAGFWGVVARLDQCASALAVIALIFHARANYYRSQREKKLNDCCESEQKKRKSR